MESESIQTNTNTSPKFGETAEWFEISDLAQLPVKPTVSILMLAYNHADYLIQAIESVLAQKTDFNFELIIGEDCSSDNTLTIARQQQCSNPNIIRIITANTNVGAIQNFVRILEASRGEFIALCEGDDFWISHHKLQKQVDALEMQSNIDICFHKSATLENGQMNDSAYIYESRIYKLEELVLADFHFMQTNTLMFRKCTMDSVFLTFMKETSSVGDFFIRFYSGINGAICIDEQMGCYRVLSSGSWSSQLSNSESLKKHFVSYLKDLDGFDEILSLKYTSLLFKYKILVLNAVENSNIKLFDKLRILTRKTNKLGFNRFLRFIIMAAVKNGYFRALKCLLKEKLPIRLLCLIRSWRTSDKLKIGSRSYIHNTVHVLGKRGIQIGVNSCVSEGSWLNVNHRQGDNISIEIGNNCFIGKQNFFTSGSKISIGDYTLTTIGCKFIGSSHRIDNPEVPYLLSGTTNYDKIKVGVNCFLGAGVTVLGNVNIGHGSVIGTDALVIRDIPPFSIAVGNPAKVLKRYNFKHKMWIAACEISAEDEASMPTEQEYLTQLKEKFPHVHMPWIAAGKSMGDL